MKIKKLYFGYNIYNMPLCNVYDLQTGKKSREIKAELSTEDIIVVN